MQEIVYENIRTESIPKENVPHGICFGGDEAFHVYASLPTTSAPIFNVLPNICNQSEHC